MNTSTISGNTFFPGKAGVRPLYVFASLWLIVFLLYLPAARAGWSGMWGAFSYENENYKLNMIDQGHWYELKLKHPADQYVLLYQVGDEWKVVNWNIKNDDQN